MIFFFLITTCMVLDACNFCDKNKNGVRNMNLLGWAILL